MKLSLLTTTTALLLTSFGVNAFNLPSSRRGHRGFTGIYASSNNNNEEGTTTTVNTRPNLPTTQDDYLQEQTFGGYTVKQRLREEVESPFRKVRLVLFGSSTGSALIALYFSTLNTIKALNPGGFADAPPLNDALTSDAINLGSAILCGFLAFREYNVGEANLKRIARGGKLASLIVEPASSSTTFGENNTIIRQSLKDYRRNSRVVIAAGGPEYIKNLALTLTSDQLADTNVLPSKLEETDVIVVPVLLEKNSDNNGSKKNKNKSMKVVDTKNYWYNEIKADSDGEDEDNTNRNFDITRANKIIAFPRGNTLWTEYLETEIDTAKSQGFNVLEKGITLTVKKNGRILRRATGIPRWADIIQTMEVLDGKFGMPGDDEKYGK